MKVGQLSIKVSQIIVLSSQTNFLLMKTTFPHYLALKKCKKTEIEKNHEFLLLVKGLQSFSTQPTYVK